MQHKSNTAACGRAAEDLQILLFMSEALPAGAALQSARNCGLFRCVVAMEGAGEWLDV